ncbi:ankyrin [Annulohypoxylon moriforme]|nr:ankyrin [Annulohypoxylon moriforme]
MPNSLPTSRGSPPRSTHQHTVPLRSLNTGPQLSLSTDIIFYIAKSSTLSSSDIVRLSQTCHELSKLLRRRICRLDVREIMAIEHSIPKIDADRGIFLSVEESESLDRPCIPQPRISVLHWAASQGNIGLARASIKAALQINPAYLDSRDSFHNTPLALAATNGHVEVVNELVNAGCYVEAPIFGYTSHARRQELDHFIEHTVTSPFTYFTPLTLAIAAHQDSIAAILAQNIQSTDHQSFAAVCGMPEVIKILISKGYQASRPIHQHSYTTPLHYAVIRENNFEVIDVLMSHGASIHDESRPDEWLTPLHKAVELKSSNDTSEWIEKTIRDLLEDDDWLPAVEAAVRLLNEHGAFIRIQQLLRYAMMSYEFNPETTEFFVNFLGSKLNQKHLQKGQGYLHWALEQEHILPYLIDFVLTEAQGQLDVNAKDASGLTPLDYAERRGDKKVIGMLERFGARRGDDIMD